VWIADVKVGAVFDFPVRDLEMEQARFMGLCGDLTLWIW
jgi:hypothetical protein